MEFTRASQVATAILFHSSITTSWNWWMLETLCSSTFRLRMHHRCSIRFRSGDMLSQSITLILRIMLCFSMSQYMLAFMVPSMNCSSPVLAALMQPQTMTLPGRLTPSEPNMFILVSSDHRTWFQWSKESCDHKPYLIFDIARNWFWGIFCVGHPEWRAPILILSTLFRLL